MRKEIVYSGIAYDSIESFAKAVNLPISAVYNRLKAGWDIEKIATTPVVERRTPLVWKGVEYRSISALARAANVPFTLLRDRLTKSGMTVEEAISTPARKFGVEYMGVQYPSVRALAAATGKPYSLLQNRLEKGMSVEDAVESPLSPKEGSTAVTYGGKEYPSRVKLCEEIGVAYSTVSRFVSDGMSLEDAVSRALDCRRVTVESYKGLKGVVKSSRNTMFVCKGKTYSSLSNVAEDMGVSVNQLQYRLSLGMTLDEAVDAIRLQVSGKFEYNGEKYGSLAEIARLEGVSAENLRNRVKAGKSIEDSVKELKSVGVTYKGKVYPTKKDLAMAVGVSTHSIRQGEKRGLSTEEAVDSVLSAGLTYNGEKYPSAVAVAEAAGVPIVALRYRLGLGMSVDDAVAAIKAPGRQYSWGGKVYTSLKTLCNDAGVGVQRVSKELQGGLSLDEAIDLVKREKESRQVEYNGVVYQDMSALAREKGVPLQRVQSRLKKGWTLEEALNPDKVHPASRPVEYRNKMYPSRAVLCETLGVDYSLVTQRLSDGWTLERAVETPRSDVNPMESVVVGGILYPSKQAAYDAYDIPKHVVRTRVLNGMSLEDAIMTPWSKEGYKYHYDSKDFRSLKEIDEYIGVSEGTVNRYVRKGHTFDEACELAKQYKDNQREVIRSSDFPESTTLQRYELRKRCEGDVTKCKEWLNRVFGDYPTEFHGRLYPDVKTACADLNLPVDVVRSRMLSLMSFQEAVHDRYFVVDDTVFLTRADLRQYLCISRPVFESVVKGAETNDEVVAQAVTRRGNLAIESVSLSINRSNESVDAVINCRNGRYVVYCSVCHRPLYLTENEAREFKHSKEFCDHHTHEILFKEAITAKSFRALMSKVKDYDIAMLSYLASSNSMLSYRISRSHDMTDVKLLAGGKFAVIKCSVCGKTVLLPMEKAKLFMHSNNCEKYEWVEG